MGDKAKTKFNSLIGDAYDYKKLKKKYPNSIMVNYREISWKPNKVQPAIYADALDATEDMLRLESKTKLKDFLDQKNVSDYLVFMPNNP